LGANLKIQTRQKSTENVQIIEVNWNDFEQNPKAAFSNIDILYSLQEKFDLPNEILSLEQGVVIEISGLHDEGSWTRKKLLSLKRNLTKMVDPFGDSNSDYVIRLFCNSELTQDLILQENQDEPDKSNIVNGPISNPIIEILKTKTTGLTVKLENGFYYSELIDRGEVVYKIREEISADSYLNNTAFNCEVFFLNRSAKQTFKLRMGISSIEFGSLLLFRNGFRVYPIGEEFDDFWGLGRRKQQGTARYLSGRDILGKVEIYGPETKFKEASSRDLGLVTTSASEELKQEILSKVIRRLESYVVGISWADKLDKDYDNLDRMYLDENRAKIIDIVTKLSGNKKIELLNYNENLINVLNEKSKHFNATIEKLNNIANNSSNKVLKSLIKEAEDRFSIEKKRAEDAKRKADEEIQARTAAEKLAKEEEEKRLKAESETEKYKKKVEEERARNLFLSISDNRDKDQLESFIHQLIIYASATKDLLNDEIILLSNNNNNMDKEAVINLLSEVLQNNEKIITTSRFATSADFMLDSAQIEEDLPVYIQQYLEKVITAYNKRIKISCEEADFKFKLRFSPIELGLVFDNLVANSQKANASQINVSMSLDMKSVLVITVTDDGRGIPRDADVDRIFEKGYTTTDGSGLGLYHVKQQIESISGEITLAKEQPRRGAKFIIRIKK
jgi:signal transduction histidine kinase